jgi:hypothetical protein
VIKNGHKTINEEMENLFMKKIILFLLAMGMVGFVGCAGQTAGNIPNISNDDYSTIYMFRESRVLGF